MFALRRWAGACALPLGLLSACATTAMSPARAGIRAAIASEERIAPSKFPARSVAVLPVAADPADTIAVALSWALTEMLSQDLSRTRRVAVVERIRIGALISELALAGSGRVDTLSAPRAGRLLGARRVAAGRITRDGTSNDRYRVTLRTIDVGSGTASADFSTVVSLDDVSRGEQVLLQQLTTALGFSPAEIARAASTRPPIPTDALLRFGDGVQAVATGNRTVGVSTLQEAANQAPLFGDAKIAIRNANRGDYAEVTADDDRRAKLRSLAQTVSPLVAVRTAEAVDATAATVVQQVSISVIVIIP
jgi:TolB-like protein